MRRYSAAVLLALRDRGARDWESLCEAVGVSPRLDSRNHQLLSDLRDLESAGVVRISGSDDTHKYGVPAGEIRLSGRWHQLATALGLSLTNLRRLESEGAVVAVPAFGRAKSLGSDIFVIMPFREDLKAIYSDRLIPVAARIGLSISRADDLFTNHSIMSDVWSSIFRSKLVIADCTGRNPNVFYELGICHTLGKPVILLAQDAEDVPSDIRHLRYLEYSTGAAAKTDAFEAKLTATIREILQEAAL